MQGNWRSNYFNIRLILPLILFAIVLIVFFFPSFKFPPKPRSLPLIVEVIVLVLLAIDFGTELSKVKAKISAGTDGTETGGEPDPAASRKFAINLGASVVIITGAVLVTKLIGLILALTVMCGALTWVFGGRKLVTSLISGVAGGLIVYLVFVQALEVTFPRGILGLF